jgi:hypothetical protein
VQAAAISGRSASGSANITTTKNDEATGHTQQQGIFLENLDFQIDVQGMRDKKLLIRSSYFFGPRLFLDGKKVKPVKKQRLKRLKTYIVQDERGNSVEIKLKLRPFDAIPCLIINGKEHEIAPKYRWYDYFMIALPAFIAYMGGILGVLTGGAALYTNSILLRKIKHKVLRYTLVNINTVFAIFAFLKVILLAAPYVTDLEFRTFNTETVSTANSQIAPLSKHVWETYKLTTLQNEDVTSQGGALIGSKRYFFSSGKYAFTLNNGTYIEGKWKTDEDNKSIIISGPGETGKVEIVSMNETEIILRFNGVNYYHRAI